MIEKVGGCDVSYKDDKLCACVTTFSFPFLKLLSYSIYISTENFPYIPKFLALREGLVIINAFKKLKLKPHVLLVDGQGIAHPYFMGLATFVGMHLDISTIGCAKSKLIGEYKKPSPKKGGFSFLKWKDKIIGVALRTKDNTKELIISQGFNISLTKAIEIVLLCSIGYRIPQPLRIAHILSKKSLG